jgi:hypothetical protein
MEQLLQDIQNRLLAQVPDLKYVDEDWGQLDYYSPNPPVKFPCALIDIFRADWSNEGKLLQTGLVQVRIILADWRISNSSGAAPAGQKEKAMAVRVLERQIFQALHGWSGSRNYAKLIRQSSLRVKKEGMRQLETTYATQLTDASAMPQLAQLEVKPVVWVGKL